MAIKINENVVTPFIFLKSIFVKDIFVNKFSKNAFVNTFYNLLELFKHE